MFYIKNNKIKILSSKHKNMLGKCDEKDEDNLAEKNNIQNK